MEYKYKTVRSCVFETNSSSSHSVGIGFGFVLTREEIFDVAIELGLIENSLGEVVKKEDITEDTRCEYLDGLYVGDLFYNSGIECECLSDYYNRGPESPCIVVDKKTARGIGERTITEVSSLSESTSKNPTNDKLEDIAKRANKEAKWIIWSGDIENDM